MDQITLNRARKDLPEIARCMSEHRGSDTYMVTDRGRPTMVMMSYEKFQAYIETSECLGDENVMYALKRSAEDVAEGRVLTKEEADAAIGWQPSVYTLEYTQTAVDHLKEIKDRRKKKKIKKRIERLEQYPKMLGKPLRNELQGLYSSRAVGQRYRIIYSVDDENQNVTIWFVGIRKDGDRHDIYRIAKKLVEKLGIKF